MEKKVFFYFIFVVLAFSWLEPNLLIVLFMRRSTLFAAFPAASTAGSGGDGCGSSGAPTAGVVDEQMKDEGVNEESERNK